MDVVTLKASFWASVDNHCRPDVVGDDDNCCSMGEGGPARASVRVKKIDEYIAEAGDQLVVLPEAPLR